MVFCEIVIFYLSVNEIVDLFVKMLKNDKKVIFQPVN